MGRSIDWALQDNMMDGLFFCASLTGCRKGHTICVSRSGKVRHRWGGIKPEPRCSWQGHSRRVGADESTESRSVASTTPHSIGDPPREPHFCCCCQMNWWAVVQRLQMSVSIWDAVNSHSMARWALSGADTQAPYGTACWRQCGLRQSSAGWMPARMARLFAGVRRHPGTVRKAWFAVLCSWMDQGSGGCSQRCCSSTPTGASKPSQECDAWCQLFAKLLKVSVIREPPVQRYSEVFGLGAKG